jgi:hypothetical protein
MLTAPGKLNQDRRHHIPQQHHKVTNWPDHEASQVRLRSTCARSPHAMD